MDIHVDENLSEDGCGELQRQGAGCYRIGAAHSRAQELVRLEEDAGYSIAAKNGEDAVSWLRAYRARFLRSC
jgi:hypothetical protein